MKLFLLVFSFPLLVSVAGGQYLVGNTPLDLSSCTDGQILKYSVSLKKFSCQNDDGGGASAASDLTDFKASVAGAVLTIPAGRARIGNYAPVAIAAGGATFTAGSGDVKVFIDASNNLVCHMATGIAATLTGSLACSNVTTPAYPVNSIPIADLTIAAGTFYVTIDSDDRAFLSNRGISAGTGISIADAGGVASIGIDTATVPQLGGTNEFTGSNDFSAATVVPMTKHRTFTKSMTLLDPVAGDSGSVQFAFGQAVTITRVWCSTKTATSTVTMNLDERAEATPDTAGTDVLTSNLVCDTDSQVTTTFSNAGIAARVPVAWTIASVANAPALVRLHVEYTID